MSEQGSQEWLRKRSGKFTASRLADVMARDKRNGKHLKVWHDLTWDVAVERLTGEPIEGPDGYALRYGKEVEPYAREAYEFASGNLVKESDFIIHPKYTFVGCSPDGLIGDNGGLEMKCPKSPKVHLVRFLDGMPEEYKSQVQGCLWVTGREWWDFVSYDPRMPESHRLFLVRIERDDAYIAKLESAVLEAEAKVLEILSSIREAA